MDTEDQKGGEGQRPFRPDDLFRLRFILDAQLSPDGQSIAYALSTVHDGQDRSSIWIQSLMTGQAWQLTAAHPRNHHPLWSPDGKMLAFLSDRGARQQIHLIAVQVGEARALTRFPQGVGGNAAWSPDSEYLAFTAGPGNPSLDRSKPYRVTRPVYRMDGLGFVENALHDLYIVSVSSGTCQRLTCDACHNTGPSWSPDGKEILFTSSLCPESHRVHNSLKVVNLHGQVRTLVEDWGYVVCAAWTSDGRHLVFVGNPWDAPYGSQFNLWVIGREGGSPEIRTANLPLHVGGGLQPDMPALTLLRPQILVSPDSKTAYVKVQNKGTINIYRITLFGHEIHTPVVTGQRTCVPLDLLGKRLLFADSDMNSPLDLCMLDLETKRERQLTQVNAPITAERSFPIRHSLAFTSEENTQVEGWIALPPRGQAPYPTILYIHGGPHSAFGHVFLFDVHMLTGAGYAVLLLNPRGSTGYGDAFSTAIVGRLGECEIADLLSGVEHAISIGLSDANRLGCYGHSYGGFLALRVVGHTGRFKAAVAENPVTDWVSNYGTSDAGPSVRPQQFGGRPHEMPDTYQRCSAVTYAHACTTPTLLIQGEQDFRCPAGQAEQFYAVLKSVGCTVEMLRLPRGTHVSTICGPPGLRRAGNDALLEWLNRYVLGFAAA